MGDYTDLLYAQPSLAEGAARLLDFGGTLNNYNESPDGAEADSRAIRADWYTVGDGIRTVMLRALKEISSGQ